MTGLQMLHGYTDSKWELATIVRLEKDADADIPAYLNSLFEQLWA